MRFVKMHGIGNDYVFVECFRQRAPERAAVLSARVSDRHRGIGSDGLILVTPSEVADARMRIFNADGSEAQICGNGLRCAARLLRDEGIVSRDHMTIETGAGVREAWLLSDGVRVDMGVPTIERLHEAVEVDGETLDMTRVSMGNPHAVSFGELPDDERFRRLGPKIERHEAFLPARTNVEFARVEADGIRVRVWERGSGETQACGSGACAVLAAASARGLCGRAANVFLPGGTLLIEWGANGRVLLTGPTERAFGGEYPNVEG